MGHKVVGDEFCFGLYTVNDRFKIILPVWFYNVHGNRYRRGHVLQLTPLMGWRLVQRIQPIMSGAYQVDKSMNMTFLNEIYYCTLKEVSGNRDVLVIDLICKMKVLK